jgi:chromosome segregation ATPase
LRIDDHQRRLTQLEGAMVDRLAEVHAVKEQRDNLESELKVARADLTFYFNETERLKDELKEAREEIERLNERIERMKDHMEPFVG